MQVEDDTPIRQLDFVADTEPVGEWRIGDTTVTRVVEGITEFPRGFLPALTDDRLDDAGDWISPYVRADRRRLLLSTHSFVVRSPETLVVVDTCVGAHTIRPMEGDPTFGDRLAAAIPGGLGAVDAIVCTHLHFDHVGWNTQPDPDAPGRWRPTFPNARYLVSDAELSATLADDGMAVVEPSIQPLLDAKLLDAVASDHRIDDSLRLRPSPGHSPGHVCVEIESAGERALITGDATHSPLQFTYPDVTAEIADNDSALAIETRRALTDDVRRSDVLVLGSHFPTPTAGRVRRRDDGSVWFDGRP